MGLYSRRFVGWSMADHMRTELVRGALEMAIGNRKPAKPVLGSRYASWEYQRSLKAHSMECSMSRKAECHNNAVAESFFGTLKTELVYRHS